MLTMEPAEPAPPSDGKDAKGYNSTLTIQPGTEFEPNPASMPTTDDTSTSTTETHRSNLSDGDVANEPARTKTKRRKNLAPPTTIRYGVVGAVLADEVGGGGGNDSAYSVMPVVSKPIDIDEAGVADEVGEEGGDDYAVPSAEFVIGTLEEERV
jgi:hypothetical protein